ncbi:MAG: LysR family transcriptional regulator [Ruminiclostridium sp.]|nr:LysR family transcriptional regulator [Ruminiclostridium sp.]
MTLQQLKYMVTIAEKGNISRAAQELFISQPSLTNSIKELENELQFTVFERTNKGVIVSARGSEFLGYARQVLQQYGLLEERYLKHSGTSPHFSVSTQHYPFAVKAFVEVIKQFDSAHYDFMLRETQTYEIIDDVSRMKSEIGILYKSKANEPIIDKLLKQYSLSFEELCTLSPKVFISSMHPLAKKDALTLEELSDYPYLSFEQGEHNSFYYSEEILSEYIRPKNIKISDRATLSNLLIGLDGYTIGTGIINEDLNGKDIISKPLISDEEIKIGIITRNNVQLSVYARTYIGIIKSLI